MNRTILATVLLASALVLMGPTSTSAQQSYTEDFTTTAYRDTLYDKVDWNTADGELKLFPFDPLLVGGLDTPDAAHGVAVAGDLAFVADGLSGLQVIDISDPANPEIAGYYDTPDNANGVVVAGDLAFVADRLSGLQIIDISDPANPSYTGSYDTPEIAWGVAVAGDLAFVADGLSGLQIIDISNPASPTYTGSFDTPGDAIGVAVAGDLAFVADGTSLQIIDISNPEDPTFASSYVTPDYAYGVAVDGDLVFVADGSTGLQIIDISDPAIPAFTGNCDTPGWARSVTVAGDCAFVGDTALGLQIIDIRNPSDPTIVESYDTPVYAECVAVAGDLAFVADHDSGLQAIRINYLVRHTLAGSHSTPDFALDIELAGNHAFIADRFSGLQIMDITNPTSPSQAGSFDTPGSASGVAVAGDLAFVADDAFGLQIIDITNPASPTFVAVYDTLGNAVGVTVAGDLAFVADGSFGLLIVDISNPAIPRFVGTYDTPGFAQGVTVAGDLAFVADGSSGLQIINIINPEIPTFVGAYDTEDYAQNVTVAGDRAYVADRSTGLQIIDITDPENPIFAGNYQTQTDAYDVTVIGDHAFLACISTCLYTVDMTNPANPFLVGVFYGGAWGAEGIAVAGDLAFVAARLTGMEVIRVFQHEFDTTGTSARSLWVDGGTDKILRVRLSSTQTEGVSWKLYTFEVHGTAVIPGETWTPLTFPGFNLRWISTHSPIVPGVNPTVSDLRIEWLNEYATISSITDLPGDQGGRLDVNISRSGYDFTDETLHPVTGYNLYRRIDDDPVTAKALDITQPSDGQVLVTPSGQKAWPLPDETIITSGGEFFVLGAANPDKAGSFPSGTWKLVSTAFATQSDNYLVEATTVADSTNTGIDWSVYLVTTHTTTPSVWFISQPDSGYSVDNIAPGVPTSFGATYETGGVNLDWDDAPEPDFQFYRVYRDDDAGFIPSPENIVYETAASGWTDPATDPWGNEYKITTIDHAGNESEPASPVTVSGVQGGELPTRTALLGAVPNPFNPSTRLSFELAVPGHVRLGIYDVAGRQVTNLLDEHRDAGNHHMVWDGRNNEGRACSAGIYLYRLETDSFSETKRMVLVK